jgi:hypothetical protein
MRNLADDRTNASLEITDVGILGVDTGRPLHRRRLTSGEPDII